MQGNDAAQGRQLAARKRTRGMIGEEAAAGFLRNKGFRLVARNWRNPRDQREEIDLICLDGFVLVFVEVKTRRAGALITGFHAVNMRKKRALRRAIQAYLWELPANAPAPSTRCDVVEVELTGDHPSAIYHYEAVTLRTPRPWR